MQISPTQATGSNVWSRPLVWVPLMGLFVWVVCLLCSGQAPAREGLSSEKKSRGQTSRPTQSPKTLSKATGQKVRMKGMTISCFGWGAAWATPLMRKAMVDVKRLGGNWISYHPYASIRDDGSLSFSTSTKQPTVLTPMRYAKQLGMKILLKPHIGYWRSNFSWRGSISFQKESNWKRFFRDYKQWIVVQAKMAAKGKADLFSVGIEYQKTLHRKQDWLEIIRAVRKVYSGKLTYSANWDAYHKVPFWDKLDYIGIQAYFPLTKKTPTTKRLRSAWHGILQKLQRFSKKHKKPIILTELGYNRAAHTAARPWDHKEGGQGADSIKLRCVDVALSKLRKAPYIHGVFLWKWFPTLWDISSNYTLQYPAMKKVLKRAWK